ncbi:hypothetical protein CC2G_014934 [Coprinopsis cinerea AmutBmut pab1-1]|nr:hypothetical protein CC2G_014934 [Coprinopsis cinerea AmutBmut pab1-1]
MRGRYPQMYSQKGVRPIQFVEPSRKPTNPCIGIVQLCSTATREEQFYAALLSSSMWFSALDRVGRVLLSGSGTRQFVVAKFFRLY